MSTKLDYRMIDTGETNIWTAVTGAGPPLLLLHGHPQTHMMWLKVAELLAPHFTLVIPDLRGYGRSGKPPSRADHMPYSKRVMAQDMVAVMDALGFDRFHIAGHDRGGRVTHRLCLDHPQRVTRAAVLDIAPTLHMYSTTNRDFATGYWHWFFLIQPHPLPEKIIGADPLQFWRLKCGSGAAGLAPFAEAALADYLECYANADTIHAICEDYRASATIDLQHDQADVDSGRKLDCPLLVLWGRMGKIGEWYDPVGVWRQYATQVHGAAVAAGHYLAEESPAETGQLLLDHFITV